MFVAIRVVFVFSAILMTNRILVISAVLALYALCVIVWSADLRSLEGPGGFCKECDTMIHVTLSFVIVCACIAVVRS